MASDVDHGPGDGSIDRLFIDWHERWQPPPGWITMTEAVAHHEARGLRTPLPEVLTRGEVPVHGHHMHGPGGPLPPYVVDDTRRWEVNIEENWARERKYPESAQYRVQIAVHRVSLEDALQAAIAEELESIDDKADAEIDASRRAEGKPDVARAPQPPGADVDRPVRSSGRIVRPSQTSKPSMATCCACEAMTNAAQPEAAGYILMGHVNGAPLYLCGDCREYVRNH